MPGRGRQFRPTIRGGRHASPALALAPVPAPYCGQAKGRGRAPYSRTARKRRRQMFPAFFIIDDFFDNPMEVRRLALAATYTPPTREQNYPGRMSAKPMLWPSIDRMFSAFVGEPVVGNPEKMHGYFRITYEGERGANDIHIDTGNVWAGVLYLTLPEHCKGGTEFFRHRQYGTEHAPLREEDLKVYGARDRLEVLQKTIGAHTNDRSKWERTMTLPMKFNRLVLFRSWYWHTAGESFGDAPENARLVQLFFFNSALNRGRIG